MTQQLRNAGESNARQRRRLHFLARAVVPSLAAACLIVAPLGAEAAQAAITPATSATSGAFAAVTAAPVLPAGAAVAGSVASGSEISAAVALQLPDPAAVTNFITEVSSPRSALYHQYLAPGQFAIRFGPARSTIAAVEAQLRSDGLTVTNVSSNGLLVSFEGSAANVESAFKTGLEKVRLADGSTGQATTSPVELPASIAPYVQAVVGLDQLVKETNGLTQASSASRPAATVPASSASGSNGGPVACASASALATNGAITDQQVANSYGLEPLYSAGDLASSQTVDIYELEPFLTSDVATFDQCYFGTDNTGNITTTTVDGGPGTGPGSAEAALDIDDVSAIAPGAKIDVFSGPNMDNPFGPLDTWNAIAIADNANQVSSSWGVCETALQEGAPGVQQVENEIFEQTAAQGQTVFAAAGDDGSDSCAAHASAPVTTDLSLLDPASQPYVTSVGGTTFLAATEPPDETVWNNGNDGGAGGGGISETWAMPPWQTSVAVPQTSSDEACSNDPSGTGDLSHLQGYPTTLPAGTLCRETPDVSALADPQSGITIVYDGSWYQIGGTSSATPLWAAMLAEINGSAACSSLSGGLGFADPLLYGIAGSSSANYADAFSDITIGNNNNLNVGGAGPTYWPAGPGYDLASGLGTPRITDADGSPGLAAQMCAAATATGTHALPFVTGLSPVAGSTAGGGTATIAGSNFGSTQGSVYFGAVDAPVVSWGPTSITVDIPAYLPPIGTPPGSAGRADVTVVTGGSSPESSSLSPSSIYYYTATTTGQPVVDYVSSPNGPTAGGNTVTIVGAGLSGATSVKFGTAAASIDASAAGNSDNELTVTVPPQPATCAVPSSQGVCAVAVTVTTPHGTSQGPAIEPAYKGPLVFQPNGAFIAPPGCGCEVVPAPEEYDYAPVPVITGVSPQYQSTSGGTTLVISGSGFNLLTWEWVNIGPAGINFDEDFSLVGISATTIAVTVPAAAPSVEPTPTAVSVQTGGGLSNVFSFDYAGTPVISALSEHDAPQPDPGDLTISGQGLQDVTTVEFVGVGTFSFLSSTTTDFVSQPTSGTSLTVVVPQFFSYPTDVYACSVSGCDTPTSVRADAFILAYPGAPVLTSASPTSGPAQGGTVVTLNGYLDNEVVKVHFGSVEGQVVNPLPCLAPSCPVEVIAPPGTPGTTVYITITTVGGTLASPPQPTSADTPDATFTYEAANG